MAEIFLLGLLGFLLVKKAILSAQGIDDLSRLVVSITLPLFIFSRFIQEFRLSLFPNWWLFPVLSIAITFLGFLIGSLFAWVVKEPAARRQFLSLIGFQNSGYLPLLLIAALLPADEANHMFIYLFLFLAGFNLLLWSLGVHFLTCQRKCRFEFASLFSAPVVATLCGLLFVFFGWENAIPRFIFHPLKIVGDATLPLAMIVVGGSLAGLQVNEKTDRRALLFAFLAKLIILPLIVMIAVIGLKAKIPYLIALLLIMQAAMPPATSLSVIIRRHKEEDHLINSGIFFGHILSILTIPVFLTYFFFLYMR